MNESPFIPNQPAAPAPVAEPDQQPAESALAIAQAILSDPLWSAIAVRSEAIGCHIEARYAGKYHLAWDATAEGAARILAEIGPREHVAPVAINADGLDVALPPSAAPEPEVNSHESNGETGEAFGAEEPSEPAGDGLSETDTPEGVHGDRFFQTERHEEQAALDADFIEPEEPEAEEAPDLGAELLDEGQSEWPALEDHHETVEAAPEAPATGHDRFYGLDDLDRVRKLKIAAVATLAAELEAETEAGVCEVGGEHANLTAFVVTHLDKHTGAFTLQDAESLASYRRWIDLETARSRQHAIDRARKAKTTFLLNAAREEVEAFEPAADWP